MPVTILNKSFNSQRGCGPLSTVRMPATRNSMPHWTRNFKNFDLSDSLKITSKINKNLYMSSSNPGTEHLSSHMQISSAGDPTRAQ